MFKVLYSLITFGVVLDPELAPDSLDPPESMIRYFRRSKNIFAGKIKNIWSRLRLVCVLLDTCGQYFVSGSSKKKLDYYLLYFQRYYLFKKSCYPSKEAFPLGMSQLVLDTLTTLKPKIELYEDFEVRWCELT